MPIGGFFALAIAGIISGFVYEIGLVVRFLFKNRIVTTVIVDFFVAAAMGALFLFAEFRYLNLRIYGFGIAAYVFGIVIERMSLGFLLAKNLLRIYNGLVSVKKKLLKTRFGKRIAK